MITPIAESSLWEREPLGVWPRGALLMAEDMLLVRIIGPAVGPVSDHLLLPHGRQWDVSRGKILAVGRPRGTAFLSPEGRRIPARCFQYIRELAPGQDVAFPTTGVTVFREEDSEARLALVPLTLFAPGDGIIGVYDADAAPV